jgi:hypothetical protein
MDEAMRLDLVSFSQLTGAGGRWPFHGRHDGELFVTLVEELLPKTVNDFEKSLLEVVDLANLPRPVQGLTAYGPDGRFCVFDYAWEPPHPKLALEADSVTWHTRRLDRRRDRRKDRIARHIGYRLLRFDFQDLTVHRDATVIELQEAWATLLE